MAGSGSASMVDDSDSEVLLFDEDDQSECAMMSDPEGAEDQMVIEPPEVRKSPFAIMTREELRDRQQRAMQDAAELLDVAEEDSFTLLRVHGWDISRLQEAWFQDDVKVRLRCGLITQSDGQAGAVASSSPPTPASGSQASCPICMTQPTEPLAALGCGHGFCQECWQQYLQTQVDDGKVAIQARCPSHKCSRIVPVGYFHKYCDEQRRKKYEEWFLFSFVDDNPVVKWCTNPNGCRHACEHHGVDPCEICCACDFHWCWACGEEAHRPANCKTVNLWNIKNSAESENISWIRANTKKCPKCHKPIEKNQGCNHMICSKSGGCGHEFCWLCLGEWATHGTATGGYYQCNIYDKQAKEGKHNDEESSRQKAKHALDKYIHYFERFMDHDRGMKITEKEEEITENKVKILHDKHGFEVIELQFLHDALVQVRACRRVLKWSYVYGYYLEDDNGPEKNLFEHLQKHLEEKTDHLHELLEKESETIYPSGEDASADASSDERRRKFMEFRSRVTNYTSVTQKFLTQIVIDLGAAGKLTGCKRGAPSNWER